MNVVCQGQTFKEWFKQKKTQKEYLMQQVAALKVYVKYLKKGYDITRKGLNTISAIKDGNLKDHSTYFTSLGLVNSHIRGSSKVSLIVMYEEQILIEFKKLRKDCSGNEFLTADETQYIDRVYNRTLSECESSIANLNLLITNNSFQMKDDERIACIEDLYEDMKDRYAFTRSFCNSTRTLIAQRQQEKLEVELSGVLNRSL